MLYLFYISVKILSIGILFIINMTNKKLEKILIGQGIVARSDFELAQKEAEEKEGDLVNILVKKEIITDEQLGKAIAKEFNYNFVNLSKERIGNDVLDLITPLMRESKEVIAFGKTNKGIKLAMTNPEDLKIRHLIEKRVGQKVIPYFVTKSDFQNIIDRCKNSLREVFNKILIQLKSGALTTERRDEFTVKIVDLLVQYGCENKASDIHIEPYDAKAVVRFRIDGIMHKVLEIPKNLLEPILMRIKILSKMRTDEQRAAQDGKFRFEGKNETIDVRVSVVPVTEGENAVMRLLSTKNRKFGLESLGLSGDNLEKVQKAIDCPHGMILVTGPTGSGKTTTLYSILKILNKSEVHISTIEDPVEYDIETISQINVNPKTNLTFAKGLRAIVRQDPDIIMVGEIRDEETASIAVTSALTGHLVLSTLHTNDAATCLPRLINMGIEPFLVVSTVNIVIGQRLVRKICEKCKASYGLLDIEKKIIENEPSIKKIFKSLGYSDLNKIILHKGTGCKFCANTGFSGRTSISEVLEINDEIKNLMIQRAPSSEITEAACRNGMTTMLEDGLKKVLKGTTTLQELMRVTTAKK